MEIQSNARIAVVGAGAMGAGIAQVAAAAGHPVSVIDTSLEALDRGRALVDRGLAGLVRRGILSDQARIAIAEAIDWTQDLSQAASAALVIEAIVERAEVKTALFQALVAMTPPEAILASNTSSLSIKDLGDASGRPDRFIGLHFFNPAPVMKLVEVVAGPRTLPEVTLAAFVLMRRWGKHAVLARDVPGFIVNRVARPYYAEGFAALAEGLNPADIDHALTAAGGFPMGPLALGDLIGHDVNYAVACSVHQAYEGRTRFRPQPAQGALVADGRLGRKTGQGVYDHDQPLPKPGLAPTAARSTILLVGPLPGRFEHLVQAARNAGLRVGIDADLPPERLVVDGFRLAFGDGRRLAARPDLDVLIDPPRDLGQAKTLVLTASRGAAADAAAGLAQTLSLSALRVSDRPGQIVLRTLAQLANAAADAVADDVASAEDIDLALVHGANHPQGPLAWARAFGPPRLANVLRNIAEATGDELYAPAPLFSILETDHD